MGGRASRDKGNRFERAVVIAMNAAGLDAKRVPLSGAMAGFKGDIHYKYRGVPRVMECKSRKKAWQDLYDYLDDPNINELAIKKDGREPLIVTRFADHIKEASE
jgi:Holliday junction resolvase